MNEQSILNALRREEFVQFVAKVYDQLHQGAPPLNIAWYIRAICFRLQSAVHEPGDRLVITVPPRHLKSIIVAVAYVAWVLGRDPTRKLIVATYSEELARDHSGKFRRVVNSDWYKALFPGMEIADERLLEMKTSQGGGRKAVSVNGTVTGLGADEIILDDCLKADEARSQTRRDELKNWLNETLLTRLNDIESGTIISIQQRLHEDDLPAYLVEKGYEHLSLPAIAIERERIAVADGEVHVREIGDLLDPKRQTREQLDRLRIDLGPQAFEAQYQQNPVAPGGNLVRLEWFGIYDEALERPRYLKIVQSWDTGMTAAPTSDFSVCTTWGYFEDKWWLLDVLRQRMDYPDLKRAVLRLARQWQADRVVIEDAGSGKSLYQEFRAEKTLRPFMWRPEGDKEERLIGVTGQLEAGKCLLPAEAPWLEAFRSELRAFPHSRHDDQVDSLSQFLQFQLSRKGWIEREYTPEGRPRHVVRPKRVTRRAHVERPSA